MSIEDYIAIIAEKDEEIASLHSEIERLKAMLNESQVEMEELVIPDDSVTDEINMTLKSPNDTEEDENQSAVPDMSNLMNLMSMLMNSSNMQNEAEDDADADDADADDADADDADADDTDADDADADDADADDADADDAEDIEASE